MQRYFIELSYKGTDFFGWQRQLNQNSVQQEIEDALSKMNSNEPISVVGCGRTDTGVHAKQYFIHVDLPELDSIEKSLFKLNRMLPETIVIHDIQEVSDTKHARFDATKRTYRYFIHQRKDAFINETSWHFPQQLNFELMNEAAQLLIGTRDFTSFSKLHTDVKTNICTVSKAEWIRFEDGNYYFEISADRFLRNMVRATVGTLMDVGTGKITTNQLIEILDAKDRQAASHSVPAHGLFLWSVEY